MMILRSRNILFLHKTENFSVVQTYFLFCNQNSMSPCKKKHILLNVFTKKWSNRNQIKYETSGVKWQEQAWTSHNTFVTRIVWTGRSFKFEKNIKEYVTFFCVSRNIL